MVLASKYASRPIPDVTLTQFFRDSVAPFIDQTALVDGPSGRSYTYRQVLDLSASVLVAEET